MSSVPSFARLRRAAEVDLRRETRESLGGAMVRAFWLESEGGMQSDLSRVMNISRRGILLELNSAPARNSVLRIQGERIGLNGTAQIRHLTRAGSKYLVGAEFERGTEWRGNEPKAVERETIPASIPAAVSAPAPAPRPKLFPVPPAPVTAASIVVSPAPVAAAPVAEIPAIPVPDAPVPEVQAPVPAALQIVPRRDAPELEDFWGWSN